MTSFEMLKSMVSNEDQHSALINFQSRAEDLLNTASDIALKLVVKGKAEFAEALEIALSEISQ